MDYPKIFRVTKWITFLFVIVFILGVIVIYRVHGKSEKEVVLHVGWANAVGAFVLPFADSLGYFKDEGLKIDYTDFLSSTINPAQIHSDWASGKYDIALSANSSFLSYPENYKNGKFVLVNLYGYKIGALIGHRYEKSLSKSQGKVFGVYPGANLIIYWVLSRYGVSPSDVKIVNSSVGDLIKGFKNGEFDYVYVYDRAAFKDILSSGDAYVIYEGDDAIGLDMIGTTFYNKFIKDHHEQGTAFARAYFRGLDQARKNPDSAINFTAAWLHRPRDQVKNELDDLHLLDLQENINALDIGYGFTNLSANLKFIALTSLTLEERANLNIYDLIDSSFLRDVKKTSKP